MQEANIKRGIRSPSYPLAKAIMRTNGQVRTDRSGLTAGYTFRSKPQLDRTMADLQSNVYIPVVRHGSQSVDPTSQAFVTGKYHREKGQFRYWLWEVLHRLQDFGSRFAFGVTPVTTLISIPARLPQSRGCWNDNESWWVVVASPGRRYIPRPCGAIFLRTNRRHLGRLGIC